MATHTAARLLAVARVDPDSPDLAQLVGELVAKSPEFARMWERHDVVEAPDSGCEIFRHLEVGLMTLSFEVMTILHTDGQRMIIYGAPIGTPDHDAMVLLDMWHSR